MHTPTTLQTTFANLTRRLQGARASGEAYRMGRRGSRAACVADDAKRTQPREACNVVPFRPR